MISLRFRQLSTFLFCAWIVFILIQMAGRAYLYFRFNYLFIDQIESSDISALFITGLRYDIRMASIPISALFILSLLAMYLPVSAYRLWTRILILLTIICTFIILCFTLTNIGFYTTFGRYIDLFIFGFMDDDTKAIIETIWLNYPVISGTIFLIVALIAMIFGYRMLFKSLEHKITKSGNLIVNIVVAIVLVGLLAIGCRGSFGKFPIRKDDASISTNSVINAFVPNGLMAFSWAVTDYRNENQLSQMPFAQSQQALNTFFALATQNQVQNQIQNEAPSLSLFEKTTAENAFLEQYKPNVVLAVMESLGSYLMTFDSSENDLMGDLKAHYDQDFTYPHFLSEGNGTIDTLSRLFLRSSFNKIGQSSAQFYDYVSNQFAPYKANGYKIIYLTSGNGSWQNLNQFLPHLGVDVFVDENVLKKEYPDAPTSTWGVSDEYMFKYAEKLLAQANAEKQPVFIMMMSITNHAPYSVPTTQPYITYDFPEAEKAVVANFGPEKETQDMLNTFRYSNDQLGKFISWVKENPVGKETIVAFTGDHNTRSLTFKTEELAEQFAVPFYLYVPKAYQKGLRYDPSIFASHKDILPTLYALSLSNTKTYELGCNLMAKEQDKTWCNVSYNSQMLLSPSGVYQLSTNSFYPWADSQKQFVKPTPAPLTDEQLMRFKAFTDVLTWQLLEQVEQNKKAGK